MSNPKSSPPRVPAARTSSQSIGPMGARGAAHAGMGLVEKARDFRGTMRSLMGYLKPYWVKLIVVVILAIGSTVFMIVGPKLLGNVTNQIASDYFNQQAYDQIIGHLPAGTTLLPGTTGATVLNRLPGATVRKIPSAFLNKLKALDLSHRPTFDFASIERLAFILLALYAASALLSYIQAWIMVDISQEVTYRFRRDISQKINRLPLKYFDGTTHGDVLSRLTNDVTLVNQTLNQSLTQIITAATSIVGILIMMLTISWQMTLVALLTIPLSFGIIAFILKSSQRYFAAQQNTLGDLNGHIEEMYGGHTIMRVFNGEARSIATFVKHNERLYDSAWKSQFLSGLLFPIMTFVGNLGYVGVSVLGGYLAVTGKLQIGDIQAFIQYMNSFNQPIVQTANVANVLQSTAAAAERVFEFLGEAEEAPDPVQPATITVPHGAVEFDHVVFGYHPDKVIIHDFSATVKSGQRIAIVGPTGAGKTTMVNLLMRFYELNSGAIRIDDVDTSSMKRADVRRLFGMVLQDTWLFNGTIKENLAYGNPKATQAQIEQAAKAAHVDHIIRALPEGYGMVLNEEADNLSQGEKQLVTIARAMLADPPILILDEATSSVDTRTEQLIQKAMDKLMKGRTSFVIAHRLSTIRDADLILVMRDGNIVEQGTHTELLKRRGFYADLYNSQFTVAVEA